MKRHKNIEVTVITVAFENKGVLKRLLASIPKSDSIEVVVIDNSVKNRGFGKACNEGAKQALGKYLFFVNPDCVLKDETIPILLDRIKRDKNIGIIGPQLKDDAGRPYLSSTQQPSFFSSPLVYSALNKIPNNISKRHWYADYDLDKERRVGSISGAAMLMPKKLFEEVGGFDENYFLYWEDNDLCRRILEKGYQILYCPKAQVVHSKGKSTNVNKREIVEAFKTSRWYFFSKHFGRVYATLLEMWFALFEEWKLISIVILAAFLRFDRITTLMPLIGDQGRDFMAAYVALQTGELPLLGIHSSIPRFQQGPVYIWLLTAVFGLFGIRAEWAGLMSALLGLLAVIGTYFLVYRFLDKKTALLSTLILAVSPLVVTQARLAFMTNPIPLASTALLWVLLKKPKSIYTLGLVGLAWALLFQFELAAAPLLLLVLLYWYRHYFQSLSARYVSLLWGVGGILVGLLPQVIYDFTHNFKQLGMFGVWVGYRLASFFGFDAEHTLSAGKMYSYWNSLDMFLGRFWDWHNGWGAYVSLLVVGFGTWKFRRVYWKSKELTLVGWSVIWLLIQLLGYLVHGAPSEAYFPLLFVPLAILSAWVVVKLPQHSYKIAVAVLLIWAGYSAFSLMKHDYYMATEKNLGKTWQTYGAPLHYQQEIVTFVGDKLEGQPIAYRSVGPGTDFESYMDGYRFLTISSGSTVDDAKGIPVYIFNSSLEAAVKEYWIFELFGSKIALPRIDETKN